MRLRRSRTETYYHKKRIVEKDREGSTRESYGTASSVERLNYIRNVRISGKYEVKPDEKGRMHYILENGTDIQELDGICLFVGKDAVPDYRIISIKPYRMLSLEVEKL